MVLHLKRLRLITVLGIGLFMGSAATRAEAGPWPDGQSRSISGYMCTPFSIFVDSATAYCPYISDYDPIDPSMDGYWNGDIFVDFHVSSVRGGWTQVSACRQPYWGGSIVCGAATQEQDGTTGAKDVWVSGLENVPGIDDGNDYLFVEIVTAQTVDEIYGASFGP